MEGPYLRRVFVPAAEGARSITVPATQAKLFPTLLVTKKNLFYHLQSHQLHTSLPFHNTNNRS